MAESLDTCIADWTVVGQSSAMQEDVQCTSEDLSKDEKMEKTLRAATAEKMEHYHELKELHYSLQKHFFLHWPTEPPLKDKVIVKAKFFFKLAMSKIQQFLSISMCRGFQNHFWRKFRQELYAYAAENPSMSDDNVVLSNLVRIFDGIMNDIKSEVIVALNNKNKSYCFIKFVSKEFAGFSDLNEEKCTFVDELFPSEDRCADKDSSVDIGKEAEEKVQSRKAEDEDVKKTNTLVALNEELKDRFKTHGQETTGTSVAEENKVPQPCDMNIKANQAGVKGRKSPLKVKRAALSEQKDFNFDEFGMSLLKWYGFFVFVLFASIAVPMFMKVLDGRLPLSEENESNDSILHSSAPLADKLKDIESKIVQCIDEQAHLRDPRNLQNVVCDLDSENNWSSDIMNYMKFDDVEAIVTAAQKNEMNEEFLKAATDIDMNRIVEQMMHFQLLPTDMSKPDGELSYINDALWETTNALDDMTPLVRELLEKISYNNDDCMSYVLHRRTTFANDKNWGSEADMATQLIVNHRMRVLASNVYDLNELVTKALGCIKKSESQFSIHSVLMKIREFYFFVSRLQYKEHVLFKLVFAFVMLITFWILNKVDLSFYDRIILGTKTFVVICMIHVVAIVISFAFNTYFE